MILAAIGGKAAKAARPWRPGIAALIRAAAVRARLADRRAATVRRAIGRVWARHVREAAARAAAGARGIAPPDAVRRWARELAAAMRPPLLALAADAWDAAGDEVRAPAEKAAAAAGRYAGKAGRIEAPGRADPRGRPGEAGSFLARSEWKDLDAWVQTTAHHASQTNARLLEAIFREASEFWDEELARGLTPREIADRILAAGIETCAKRAAMLARTGTIWAANEGALARYRAEGVAVVEWLTADDDMRCPFCAEMNGVSIPAGEAFWRPGDTFSIEAGTPGAASPYSGTMRFPEALGAIRHPPLHPNCRCTIIPVVDEWQIEVLPDIAVAEGVSRRFAEEVQAHIRAMPEKMRRKMREMGVRVRIPKDADEALGRIAGERPPGYPPETTWRNVPGWYSAGTISIPCRIQSYGSAGWIENRVSDSLLWHEAGHAYDYLLMADLLSNDRELTRLYDRAVARMSDDDRRWLGYYLQQGDRGRSETVAEAFAHAYGRSGNDRFSRAFQEVIRWVKRRTEQWVGH
ncbi:MAG: phage minor head protein [Planctomycetota bacterium]|nr:phage minor head protein [Planctomycetota bacterium]